MWVETIWPGYNPGWGNSHSRQVRVKSGLKPWLKGLVLYPDLIHFPLVHVQVMRCTQIAGVKCAEITEMIKNTLVGKTVDTFK